jgi:hypothetical protein
MNVRVATILLLVAALVGGAFVVFGGHGSAEAARAPATCHEMLHDSFSDHSVPWDLGPGAVFVMTRVLVCPLAD